MQYYYVLGIKRKHNSVCSMIKSIKYNDYQIINKLAYQEKHKKNIHSLISTLSLCSSKRLFL